MRSLDVDARNDDSRGEGGYAVLLFAGLEPPSLPVRFILRPLDTHVDPDRLDELAEPQDAVACQPVDGGCEIVLGPQTTTHPALETGSIVEIELVGLDVKGEFVWPAIAPQTRPRRPGLQIKKVGATRSGATPGEARPQRTQPMMIRPASGMNGAAGIAPVANQKPPFAGPVGELASSSLRKDLERPTPVGDERLLRPAANTGERAAADQSGPERREGADYVVFYPHARGGNLRRAAGGESRRRASLLPTTPGGAALTTAVAMLGVVGLMSLGASVPKPAVATSAVTQMPATGVTQPLRQPTDLQHELSLFELLSPGATSPRGASAKDVTPQKALENAQAAFLTPGAPRDPEEGAFWLRRYVASIGSDERTRRALTQLGSAYADSSNKSFDFGKARQVWELASAFGDPFAMCFLGVLHENGLAGPVDRKVSLTWFERAKTAGGCPGVDEAIARVKQ